VDESACPKRLREFSPAELGLCVKSLIQDYTTARTTRWSIVTGFINASSRITAYDKIEGAKQKSGKLLHNSPKTNDQY
jgi:hypothetical protein